MSTSADEGEWTGESYDPLLMSTSADEVEGTGERRIET
jgi:hypothetical protein